ncbi:hypothetical protein K469DRAFT_681892 [Zopfia rhizophila CBS 207.26]|uniref:Uncharacterized protein n=1 Tax=Zopfia rhizophila CBS 207.26 TaxID=1314779 RepID=A0A6A6EVM3_9PEZI|nr:hypothetical protein K469DRAFT_681892 [Zopfia rhizophila CBS 207.26]
MWMHLSDLSKVNAHSKLQGNEVAHDLAYWATDPSRSPVDRKIPIRDLLKHGRQSQESKRAHFQSELVARPFHRDGQQHPPPTNPEVPSFQSHLPRNLRRRPPQPTMKQPQQTIPRARTCSGRSHMPSATKRKRADIPNRAPKKRRSARPDENACDEWMEHIRNHDPGHGLASLMSFERVTSFRLAAAVLILPADTFRTSSGDSVTRAAMFARSAKALEAGATLNMLLVRLAELCFAAEMDSTKAGSIRVDPDRINDVLRQLEWPQTKESRNALHYRLMRGRKWLSICGNFGSGLLCLIPFISEAPYYMSQDIYYKMTRIEIDEFQVLASTRSTWCTPHMVYPLQRSVQEPMQTGYCIVALHLIALSAWGMK